MVRALRVRAQRWATRAAPRDRSCAAPVHAGLRTRARRGGAATGAARRTQTLLIFPTNVAPLGVALPTNVAPAGVALTPHLPRTRYEGAAPARVHPLTRVAST